LLERLGLVAQVPPVRLAGPRVCLEGLLEWLVAPLVPRAA